MTAAAAEEGPRRFGTFTGVFTPTLLTILGVIMYVRLPWVVGNGGLLGALAVMGLALGITLCTGLSLSSIATNIRLGAGGPYALISRSLGLEVGGSIGVPLYLSRPLGVAMYIFGFREGWLWVFPGHDPLVIDLVVFTALFTLAWVSADLAFRIQYAIMAVIAISLVSIVASPRLFAPPGELLLVGDWRGFPERGFGGTDFWAVFAVFFPATTGILAGANMSGDLADPRRSISAGTLWAIGISSVIYVALAVYAAYAGSAEELTESYTFFIDRSSFGPGVLAGLLGATFSSALASCVGGPRILMAMGENGVVPLSRWWAATSKGGEPRNAIALTAVLSFACLMLRDLNAIAPLVTMFFLLTYLMINVVLVFEHALGLVSFRPSLAVPRAVPALGALGCTFAMFIVSPTFGLLAVATSAAIFITIRRAGPAATPEDLRSGIFEAFAEWAARRAQRLGGTNARAWSPSLLVPVEDAEEARREAPFLRNLGLPKGAVHLLGIEAGPQLHTTRGKVVSREAVLEQSALYRGLREIGRGLRQEGLFTTWGRVDGASFELGVRQSLQALQSAFFRPNLLFLRLPEDPARDAEHGRLIVHAHDNGVGVVVLGEAPEAGFGERRAINLWVRPDRSGWDVEAAFGANNLDLTTLLGYRLSRRWGAELRVVTAVADEADRPAATRFLAEVVDLARLPAATTTKVLLGDFHAAARAAPPTDLSILGLQADPDFAFLRQALTSTGATCLFVADSGSEDARV